MGDKNNKTQASETRTKGDEPTTIHNYRYIFLALFVAASALMSFLSVKFVPPLPENFVSNAASAVIAAVIIFAVYAIAKKATENTEAALFAAVLAAPIQLYTWKTAAQLTHTLAVFFFLLTILGFLYLKEIDWKLILIIAVVFSFVHIYALALIPIYLLYMLFVKLEHLEVSQAEQYFIIVSSAFVLGIFALFKASPALVLVINEYVQKNYYSIAAENFTLKRAFALAGALPIYLGFFGAYESLHNKKKSALVLLASLLVVFLAMLFNIVPIGLGAPYFTLVLTCLSGFLYELIHKWLLKTKFKSKMTNIFITIVAVLLALGILHRIIFMST